MDFYVAKAKFYERLRGRLNERQEKVIARMFREGILEERTRTRYTHRISVAGEALEYVAIIAQKHADVPLAWVRDGAC